MLRKQFLETSRGRIAALFQRGLLLVLAKSVRPDQQKKIMRQAGKSLAGELAHGKHTSTNLEARVRAANDILNPQLGTVTSVGRKNGGFVIRGVACPLAAITNNQPCLVIESLVGEIVDVPVRECCDRTGRPRCCFEVGSLHA